MYEFNTNQSVELYRKTDAQRDKFGQVLTNWTLVAELFADLRFKTGKEQISSAIIEETSVSVRLVWDEISEHISADDCFKWNGKWLTIQAVLPDLNSMNYIDFACSFGKIGEENQYG